MTLSTERLVAACDRLATRPGARAPLASLTRASKTVEPYRKVMMPNASGLTKDALDDVAYANPLGYLPEIRALLAKGADEHGLALWTARMETIALYAVARVIEVASRTDEKPTKKAKAKDKPKPKPKPKPQRSVRVASDQARIVLGHLTVAGDVDNEGVMIVLGDLAVRGTYNGGDASQLVTLGDVTMGSAFVTGGVGVRGSVDAKRAFVGIGDDHAVYVGGTITAPLIALYAMSLRAKSHRTRLLLDARACDRRVVAKAKRLLVSPCIVSDADDDDEDDDFPFDLRAIGSRAAEGLPLFRRVTAKAT